MGDCVCAALISAGFAFNVWRNRVATPTVSPANLMPTNGTRNGARPRGNCETSTRWHDGDGTLCQPPSTDRALYSLPTTAGGRPYQVRGMLAQDEGTRS